MKIGFRSRRRGALEKILAPKRAEVARMQAAPPLLPRRRAGGEVIAALRRSPGEPLRLIAEVKLRSPSAGPLSRALDAPARALAYAEAGAAMVSVLTDGPFFDGSFGDLARCRDALESALGSRRPRLLCKEFILHPVQLDRAADAGADAALLIARIVSPHDLAALVAEARRRGLEPLVEVATAAELASAVQADARVIGVNARDLSTLKIDPERASAVLAAIPPAAVAVYLSGLATCEDVTRVAAGPAAAALIGEALMRQDDPRALLTAMARAALG